MNRRFFLGLIGGVAQVAIAGAGGGGIIPAGVFGAAANGSKALVPRMEGSLPCESLSWPDTDGNDLILIETAASLLVTHCTNVHGKSFVAQTERQVLQRSLCVGL